MNYKKDINIFGYVDSFGDIAKVSKTSLTNQKIKNLLNINFSDKRLPKYKINSGIERLKQENNSIQKERIIRNLKNRIYSDFPEVQNLNLTVKNLENELYFSVSYSINDSLSKNLINSGFKFTIDT